jgi:hypothetical protein
MRLEPGLAAAFARVAIANVVRAYPHKLDHLLEGLDPSAADHVVRHPVFSGDYAEALAGSFAALALRDVP